MHQFESFHISPLNSSSGEQAFHALIQIRDNLLFSLISQLSYNRILLNNVCVSQTFHSCSSASQYLKIAPQDSKKNSHEQKASGHFKRDRKIMRPSRKSRIRHASLKNDTKNIPKNYGKAILSFILKSSMTSKVAQTMGLNLPDFLIQIRKMKNRINSIDGLRKMWGSDRLEDKFKKSIRILSYHFMRKHCLRYIFYSKVRNFGTHIKYRQKLIEGIQNPRTFNHIKDY